MGSGYLRRRRKGILRASPTVYLLRRLLWQEPVVYHAHTLPPLHPRRAQDHPIIHIHQRARRLAYQSCGNHHLDCAEHPRGAAPYALVRVPPFLLRAQAFDEESHGVERAADAREVEHDACAHAAQRSARIVRTPERCAWILEDLERADVGCEVGGRVKRERPLVGREAIEILFERDGDTA